LSEFTLMGLFQWFKKRNPMHNYDFDDKDRHLSAELRHINAEKKRIQAQYDLEQARYDLEQLRDDLYGEEEEETPVNTSTPENLLTSLLIKAFSGTGSSSRTIEPAPITTSCQEELSIQQINNILGSIPKKGLKVLKDMGDAELKVLIRSRFPGVSEATQDRAVTALRAHH